MDGLRQDCSVTAEEISYYLKSRHGLCVSPTTVKECILDNGLTPDKDDDRDQHHAIVAGPRERGEGGVMDLVELTSALLIPNLLCIRQAYAQQCDASDGKTNTCTLDGCKRPAESTITSPSHFRKRASLDGSGPHDDRVDQLDAVGATLSIMLADVTGDTSAKVLDENLVREFLLAYGEGDLAADTELLREMVEVATCEPRKSDASGAAAQDEQKRTLDVETFLSALTSDVNRRYDARRLERQTTNFQDVWVVGSDCAEGHDGNVSNVDSAILANFSSHNDDEEHQFESLATTRVSIRSQTAAEAFRLKKIKELQDDKDGNKEAAERGKKKSILRLYTGEAYDFFADTYRDRIQVFVVWLTFALCYVAYALTAPFVEPYQSKHCQGTDIAARIVCPLVSGIVKQFSTIVILFVFATPFVILASVGNTIEGRESIRWMVLLVVIMVGYCSIWAFAEWRIPFLVSTEVNSETDLLLKMIVFSGVVIIALLQAVHIAMLAFC